MIIKNKMEQWMYYFIKFFYYYSQPKIKDSFAGWPIDRKAAGIILSYILRSHNYPKSKQYNGKGQSIFIFQDKGWPTRPNGYRKPQGHMCTKQTIVLWCSLSSCPICHLYQREYFSGFWHACSAEKVGYIALSDTSTLLWSPNTKSEICVRHNNFVFNYKMVKVPILYMNCLCVDICWLKPSFLMTGMCMNLHLHVGLRMWSL